MSLFGMMGLGDIEDDPFFGSHMRTMRQMNTMMNSLFADPFGMMAPDYQHALPHAASHHRNSIGNIHNQLMTFNGFPDPLQNINRILSGSLDSLGPHHGGSSSFSSSSTVVSMTSGPYGKPHVYKATSSTRVAPGGVKETQRTVCDSRTGTKKMSIGHHIGDRAHIIEREQNVHSGDQEERQDFINLEEDEADEFNREWETRARNRPQMPRIASAPRPIRHGYGAVPAITAGPSSSIMAASSRTPYSPPGYQQHARKHKTNIKTVSGSPPPAHHQQPQQPPSTDSE